MTEYKMYIIVNTDVRMPKGKMAAQVAHSAVKASHLAEKTKEEAWKTWYSGHYTKIVVGASEKEIRRLMAKYPDISRSTTDEGRTVFSGRQLTTLAFVPMTKDETPKELKKLSLLK